MKYLVLILLNCLFYYTYYCEETVNKNLILETVYPIVSSNNAIAVFIDENDQKCGYLIFVENSWFFPIFSNNFENITIGKHYNIKLSKMDKIPKCLIKPNYSFIQTSDFKDYLYQSDDIILKNNILKIKKDK